MLLTHPYPETRMKAINEYLEKNPPSPQLTEGKNLKDINNSAAENQKMLYYK